MDDHLTGILSNIGVISFVALSAYLLLLTGEISFGQQAFFAIGAYTAGIVTAMWQLPFWLGLGAGAAAGGAAALFVGLPTLRLHGLQFAIATLAFAEAVRILFELFRYQVVRDGEPVGPNGIEGFRNIRYIFEHDVSATQFMLIIYGLLGVTLFGFFLLERSRLGVAFRMIGQDGLLAAAQGVPVFRVKLMAACLAGAIAGLRRRPQTPLFSERNRHDRGTSLAAVAVCRDGFVRKRMGGRRQSQSGGELRCDGKTARIRLRHQTIGRTKRSGVDRRRGDGWSRYAIDADGA